MSRLLCSLFSILLYLGVSYLMIVEVRAAEYGVTPSVTARETYDDNIYLQDVDDFEHLISPGLKLEAETERAEMNATCTWDITEYQRYNEWDSVEQAYKVSTSLKPSALLQLDFSGAYVDDYTFTWALEEGIPAERTRRNRVTVEPGVAILLDPRNTLEISYYFDKTRYEFERYPDYLVHGLNFMWLHDLMNERTRIICAVGGNQVYFEPEEEYYFEEDDGGAALKEAEIRQRTYRVLAGTDHRFTETVQATLKAGALYTESEFPSLQRYEWGIIPIYRTEKEDDIGFILDGTMNWRLERFNFSASVNRDVAPSIYGENITRDRVRAAMRYRFTEKLRSSLSAAYYHSETEGYSGRKKEKWQTYSVRPSVIYRITEDVSLQLGYTYTWTENEITDNSEDRNRIFVQVSAAWPIAVD